MGVLKAGGVFGLDARGRPLEQVSVFQNTTTLQMPSANLFYDQTWTGAHGQDANIPGTTMFSSATPTVITLPTTGLWHLGYNVPVNIAAANNGTFQCLLRVVRPGGGVDGVGESHRAETWSHTSVTLVSASVLVALPAGTTVRYSAATNVANAHSISAGFFVNPFMWARRVA